MHAALHAYRPSRSGTARGQDQLAEHARWSTPCSNISIRRRITDAALEVAMLLRRMHEPIAPISKDTRQAENALFLRLEEHARNRPFLLDCSVQQVADDEFVAVLSDHDSGADICAWSGGADGVVVEFDAWLDKRYPQVTR